MYACVLVYCDVAYCIHNDQNCQLLPSVPSRLSVIKTWHLCGECECVTFTACAFCHFIHAIECVVEHLYIYIAKTSICAVCALWLVRVEAFGWNDLISRPGQDTTTNQQQRQSRTATTKKKHAVKEKRATELRLSEWRRPHRAHAYTHRHTFGDTTKAEKSGYKWFIVAKTANSHNFYILEKKRVARLLVTVHCTRKHICLLPDECVILDVVYYNELFRVLAMGGPHTQCTSKWPKRIQKGWTRRSRNGIIYTNNISPHERRQHTTTSQMRRQNK